MESATMSVKIINYKIYMPLCTFIKSLVYNIQVDIGEKIKLKHRLIYIE
jgi:hypothetical protein